MVPRSALSEIWMISNLLPNPCRANRTMKTALKINIKLTRRNLTLNLLMAMKRQKLGTKDAEKIAADLNKNSNERNAETVKDVMKWKIKDAENEVKKIKKEYIEVRKELRSEVPWRSEAGRRFGWLTMCVVNEEWREGKRVNEEKTNQQKRVIRENDKKVDVFEGVKVSDEALGDEDGEEHEPVVYGGVQLNNDEKEALKLPPKLAEYVKLDFENIETEIEKGCTKWRYELMNNDEGETDGGGDENVAQKNKVYDIKNKKLDMAVMRATSLPTVDRVFLPGPARDGRMEVLIQLTKEEMMQDVRTYMALHCQEDGSQKETCLPAGCTRGLKSLQGRSRNGEICIYKTDKSDRLCCDTVDNYDAAMKEHVDKDVVVTEDDYSKVEDEMNGHSVMWGRILSVGAAYGQEDRVKRALVSHDSAAPVLRGHRKDHKAARGLEEEGPPTRPVVNAKRGAISRLSHLISKPIAIVADEADTDKMCESTEEVMEAIETLNKEANTNSDIVIGSLDVKALFPSLEVNRSAEIVRRMIASSSVDIENVDYNELTKYIAINVDIVEIQQSGMQDLIHTRKHTKGPKPGMTAREVTDGDEQRSEQKTKWRRPVREPATPAERKELLGWGMEIAIKTVMKNHIYLYHGKLRRQDGGGGIGVELTGAVAKCVMTDWSKRFCLRAGELGIQLKMFKCYVDDENTVMRSLPCGTRYENEELVIKEDEIEGDSLVPEDQRNMELLKEVADAVEPMIETTVDYPSKHEDNKMPILDLKVWTSEREDGGKEVEFEFYRKPFASRFVMLASSAAPWQMKRTVLTQEGIRRLLRCRPSLPASRKCEILTEFMRMLRRSGYNEKFRLEILKSAKSGYEKIVEADKNDVKPMYRNKSWKREERYKEKNEKERDWFLKAGCSSVMFVPYTPEDRLAKKLRATMERIMGGRGGMKVVSQVGRSVCSMVQRADPWKRKHCGRAECMVCDGGKGDCTKESIRYKILCKECNEAKKYDGETAANGYHRGCGHNKLYHNGNNQQRDKSFMWKHASEVHEGRMVGFKMHVLQQYIGDSMGRQINEGVSISHTDEDRLLNSGGEWRLAHVPRLNPTH